MSGAHSRIISYIVQSYTIPRRFSNVTCPQFQPRSPASPPTSHHPDDATKLAGGDRPKARWGFAVTREVGDITAPCPPCLRGQIFRMTRISVAPTTHTFYRLISGFSPRLAAFPGHSNNCCKKRFYPPNPGADKPN